ncbi:hypothetical protein [Rhodanobacter sp. L36]|uniref:hypothetical protein n=1 Tax=Rhodanobacter sp. L36 TaxID=1747221 RepID=UPI00131CB2BB|nr:hypothetical protein [Rhodanobacter sp. L36]
MNRPSLICLLWLMPVIMRAQDIPQRAQPSVTKQSENVVSGLYTQFVARHPLGIPYGADMKAFAPYLSLALRHRFDLYNACLIDWRRRTPDPSLKPPVGLIENGVFSGANEEAEPEAFHIVKTEPGKDSSLVYVQLTVGDPPNKPLVWYVAAVVVNEKGRPVVNDVLYLSGENGEVESQLSKDMSSGCDGARWNGEGRHPR